jgi:hypothetical protein
MKRSHAGSSLDRGSPDSQASEILHGLKKRISNRAHFQIKLIKFCGVEQTVGSWRPNCILVKVLI